MTQPQWLAQQAQQAQGWSPPPAIGGPNLAVGGADSPAAAGDRPTITHIMMVPNRLVAIIPLTIDRNAKNPSTGELAPKITADILIIDGPPLPFGGKVWNRPPIPDTMVINQFPFLAKNCWISNKILVSQLERKVGSGIVVGRLYYGEAKNGNSAPYKISEDPTAEEIAFVTQWWAAYQAGQFQNPPATPLQPQTPAGFNTVPAQPAFMTTQNGPVAQQVPAFTPPAAPPAPAGVPDFGAMLAAAPTPIVEQDWTLTTFPPGFPEEHKPFWATQATKDQRTALLAQHGITGPGVPPTGL